MNARMRLLGVLVAALGFSGLLAGCGGGDKYGDPDQAAEVALGYFRDLITPGREAAAWDRLHPKAQVSTTREAYISCLRETGPSTNSISSLVEVYVDFVTIDAWRSESGKEFFGQSVDVVIHHPDPSVKDQKIRAWVSGNRVVSTAVQYTGRTGTLACAEVPK